MTDPLVAAGLALVVFVITQSILKFIIEPIQDQKKLIGEAANALVVYANASISDSWAEHLNRAGRLEAELEKAVEAQKTLHTFSGRLRASLWSIPFYRVCASLRLVPKAGDVIKAADAFIGWSNSLRAKEAYTLSRDFQDTISDKLGIERKYEQLKTNHS